MTLSPNQIDYPPCWPDRHSLRVQASGCMFEDERPGEFQVYLDAERLVEFIEAWNVTEIPRNNFAIWFQTTLPEAVDDFIAAEPEPRQLLDWALHLEFLAAKLRDAAE